MNLQSKLLPLIVVAAVVLACSAVVTSALTASQWSGAALSTLADGTIHGDGWVEEKASVALEGFSPVGNYLQFSFNPWRPGNEGVGQVAVSVCGGPEDILTAASTEPVRLSLRAWCSPIVVELRGVNPFTTAGERDARRLSVRLSDLRVGSRFGGAIPSFYAVALPFFALATLALLSIIAVGGISPLACGVGMAAVVVATGITALTDLPSSRYLPLWVFVASLMAGAALYAVRNQRRGDDLTLSRYLWIPIVAFGAALRFYGINFGLPANFHPDEVPKVNAIMRMVDQNTWNPQYFLHPSLLLYSTYFVNSLLHLVGMDGSFRDTAFLAGRIVSATAGTISLYLTYEIGRRIFSTRVGLSAALILAVTPLHVTCSRYLKEDALLTFVVLSCVLVTIVSIQSNRRWLLLLAGLLAGATAGTKYSGILMAVVPGAAPWIVSRRLLPDPKWLPWGIAAGVIAPLGFVMTTPFAVLDYAKFIKDFSAESHHMQTGHTTSIDPWSQLWMYHFWRSIVPGMTELVAIASVVGLGFLLRRGRVEDLIVVGMFVLFYLPAEFVKAKPAPQPERYIMPCLPFLALALAELVRTVGHRFRTPVIGGTIALACVAIPLTRTVQLAREVKSDTRDELASWMAENLPPGSTVLMDWKPYTPRLDGGQFNVVYIPRNRIIPALDVRALKESGADYLVLSSLFYSRYFSQPETDPALRQRVREVFERVPVVVQMSPDAGTYGFHNPVLTLFSLKGNDFSQLESELAMKRSGQLNETSNEARARLKW